MITREGTVLDPSAAGTGKVSRITAVIFKSSAPGVINALRGAGIKNIQVEIGRAPVLEERKGIFSLFGGGDARLANDPVEIISFLVDPFREADMIALVAEKARLNISGMGMVYSEELVLARTHELCGSNIAEVGRPIPRPENLYTELVGICCIVQRGQGDEIARVVLESGACVPTITYGHGTGVRDKLGLMRITIPAEKDVLTLVMSAYDAEMTMELMIAAGKLDQPGRGFIYVFSVKQGIISTRITRGASGAAANMEQIIGALDSLKGGMEWRRRGAETKEDRDFLRGLVDLSIVCDEGRAGNLVGAAMDVGASGATISKTKYLGPAIESTGLAADRGRVSPAREVCNLIVGQNQVDDIVNSLEKNGAFDDETHGTVLTYPVPRAFTFLKKD